MAPEERSKTIGALAAAELQMGLVNDAVRRCRSVPSPVSRDVLEVGRDCINQMLGTLRASRKTASTVEDMLNWLARNCAQQDAGDVLVSVAPALVEFGQAEYALRLLNQMRGVPPEGHRKITADVIERFAIDDSVAAARAALTQIDDYAAKIDALGRVAEHALRHRDHAVAIELLELAEIEMPELALGQLPISMAGVATSAQRSGFIDTALRMTAAAAALLRPRTNTRGPRPVRCVGMPPLRAARQTGW